MASFFAVQNAVGAIDVATADRDHAPGEAVENIQHDFGVFFYHGNHVEHHVGMHFLNVFLVIGQVIAIPGDVLNFGWQLSVGLTAMKNGDIVTLCNELMHDKWANKTRAANDQDMHGFTLLFEWCKTKKIAPNNQGYR